MERNRRAYVALASGIAMTVLASSVMGAVLPVPDSASVGSRPDSLSLEHAISIALARHPDLRVASAAHQGARAEAAAKLPGPDPQFELAFERGGDSFGAGDRRRFEVGLRQPIEPWGKRGLRRSVAQQRAGVAAAELERQRVAIELGVRESFRRACFAERRTAALEQIAPLDRELAASTRARVREGSITALNGRLTDLDALEVGDRLQRARGEERQARAALGAAMGFELPTHTRLVAVTESELGMVADDDRVNRALLLRGEGAVLTQRLEEKRAALRLAIRETRPDPTISASLAWERGRIAGADFRGDPAIVNGISGIEERDRVWRLSLDLPLPLRQRNAVERARIGAEIAVLEA